MKIVVYNVIMLEMFSILSEYCSSKFTIHQNNREKKCIMVQNIKHKSVLNIFFQDFQQ